MSLNAWNPVCIHYLLLCPASIQVAYNNHCLKGMHKIWIHYRSGLLALCQGKLNTWQNFNEYLMIVMCYDCTPLCNIVWLSLMRVTDWLNTVTWLTNISVCCPPQSCGGGTLIDTTKCFHSFHANKWQNELAILSPQTCMLTALDRALAVFARIVQ